MAGFGAGGTLTGGRTAARRVRGMTRPAQQEVPGHRAGDGDREHDREHPPAASASSGNGCRP